MKKLTNIGLNGRSILLLDHYPNKEFIDFHFSDKKFIKIDQVELEKSLVDEFTKRDYPIKSTLVVFIGQSSLELKNRLEKIKQIFTDYKTVYVHAQRIYESINLAGRETYSVKSTVGQVELNPLTASTYKNIIVFDDVISSGITLKSFRERNLAQFSSAKLEAFVLLSKQERIKGYEITSPVFVEGMTTPVNTFSKLTEDENVRKEYLTKHFSGHEYKEVNDLFDWLKESCIFTPHVLCFDLYNTLVRETGKWEGELSSPDGSFFHSNIKLTLPSYLDYLEESYKEKYGITKEMLYQFVRDNLMNNKYESFEEMLKLLYKNCLPNEECTTRKWDSVANNAEWYWRAGSDSAEWINSSFPKYLEELRKLGHKVVLITNATYPAWKKVSEIIGSWRFDLCLVSSLVGVSKPNEIIFKMAEDAFPEYCRNKFIMIGDIPKDDLKVPKNRGWQTFHIDDFTFPTIQVNNEKNDTFFKTLGKALDDIANESDSCGVFFH